MAAVCALATLLQQFHADLQHHHAFAKSAATIISSTRLNSVIFRLRLYLHIFVIATNQGLDRTEGRAVHAWLNRASWYRFWHDMQERVFQLEDDYIESVRPHMFSLLQTLKNWRPRVTVSGRIMMVNRADRNRWYAHFLSPTSVVTHMEAVLLAVLQTPTWLHEQDLANDCLQQYLRVTSMLSAVRLMQTVHRSFCVPAVMLQMFPLRRIFMATLDSPRGPGYILADIHNCTDNCAFFDQLV